MTKSKGIRAPRAVWTEAQIEQVRSRYPHEKTEKLAADIGMTLGQIYRKARSLGLEKTPEYLDSADACRLRRDNPKGVACRFPKGHVPANKGTRRPGYAPGRMAETQFKKGSMSGAAQHNYVPIGTMRVSKDGYLERKVTDDPTIFPARRWVGVHRLVWIEANGPIPDGHIVAFKLGQRTNKLEEITLDRLELISRIDNMKRNTYHNYPKEIAQLIQLRGVVQRQINKRSKQNERADESTDK